MLCVAFRRSHSAVVPGVGGCGLGLVQGGGAVALRLTKGPSPTVALLADAPPLAVAATLLRPFPREVTASQVGVFTAGVLFTGLLISIFTTTDPLWWHLHFSRLGTFADFSGYVFNATIVLTSVGVVAFAVRLRAEMAIHAGTAVLASRRSAKLVPTLIALLGIHLSVVGFVPVSTNEFLHDRGSTGAVFSFIAVLASSRWMLRGMHRAVSRATLIVTVGLAATTAPYIAGFINLAAFELIVFSLIFWWLLLFARTVGRPADAPTRAVAPSRVGSMHRTVVVRRSRLPRAVVATQAPLLAGSPLRTATRPIRRTRVQRRLDHSQAPRRPADAHGRTRTARRDLAHT